MLFFYSELGENYVLGSRRVWYVIFEKLIKQNACGLQETRILETSCLARIKKYEIPIISRKNLAKRLNPILDPLEMVFTSV